MTHRQDVAHGRDIVARWCKLAEQRLEYLTELFETGRWRRFHSEHAFLENIKEAKTAVETWRNLLAHEATRGNILSDASGLGRARAPLPRGAIPTGPKAIQVSLRSSPSVSPSLPRIDAPAVEPKLRPVTAAIPEPAFDSASALTLDIISAVQERYPLLRNAL
jgi:uncharacterized repeat protein (TIGR03809 family)